MIRSPSTDKGAPSPDVQISALDLDISLVDNVAFRKMLGVNEACSSSSKSSTTQGRASPQEQLEEPVEGTAERTTEENLPLLEKCGLHPRSSLEIPDQKAVAQACIAWMDTVTMGTYDAPKRTADLYAPDGVLWGTEVHAPDDPLWGLVTEEVRDTPERIYAYYDYFARLPKLRLVEYTPAPVRVHGDFGAQAGTHKFAWQGVDGATVEVRGRSSFTLRRDHPDRPNAWAIVEHCCFSMPTAATELKDAAVADFSIKTAPSSSAVSTRGTDVAPDECSAAPVLEPLPSTSSYPDAGSAAAARDTQGPLAEELAAREKQIAELQHRAETAESLAAERAVLLEMERLARAKHSSSAAELEKRARKAKSSLEAEEEEEEEHGGEQQAESLAAAAAELAKQTAENEKEVAEKTKSLAAECVKDDLGIEQDAEIYI